MRCFECGGEVIQTIGSVRMTKKDGSLIIFKAEVSQFFQQFLDQIIYF